MTNDVIVDVRFFENGETKTMTVRYDAVPRIGELVVTDREDRHSYRKVENVIWSRNGKATVVLADRQPVRIWREQ